MHERDFFNEQSEPKTASYSCLRCRSRAEYSVRWIWRTRKARLPRGVNDRGRALFSELRNYLVRVDDTVTCQKCRHRFEIPSHQNLAFFEGGRLPEAWKNFPPDAI